MLPTSDFHISLPYQKGNKIFTDFLSKKIFTTLIKLQQIGGHLNSFEGG